MTEEITEGIFIIKDFDKNKTWLINPETKEEMEVDDAIDIDHGEFLKMKGQGIAPNLYCVIVQRGSKKTFVEAHVTNMKNIEEIKEALAAILPEKEQKPGRNDPCPCGSGKKYKKCCIWVRGEKL